MFKHKEIDFLRKEFVHTTTTREELRNKFNKKFNKNKAVSTIGHLLTWHKIFKDKKYYKQHSYFFYDEENINFLRKNYEYTDTTVKELTKIFNEKFKLNKSYGAIKDVMIRYEIKKDKKFRGATLKHGRKYTKEHADFLRKHYGEDWGTQKEVLKLFDEKFNLNISFPTFRYLLDKFGLRRENTGRLIIYTPQVKKFIIKCVEEGMDKQECKDACEKEFERTFCKQTLGHIANEMGLHFTSHSLREVDKLFENPKIEELIKKVVSKNPDSNHQEVLIRDKIIEKYQKNVKIRDICYFCGMKNIKIKVILKKPIQVKNVANIHQRHYNLGREAEAREFEW